jgi:hypothetical protein
MTWNVEVAARRMGVATGPPACTVVKGRWLTTRVAPVTRLSEDLAVIEVSHLGLPKYFQVHKGEGTCHPVTGPVELVLAAAQEQLRLWYGEDCRIITEDDAVFGIMTKPWLTGVAYFVYGSDEPGHTDCEIIYASGLSLKDNSAYAKQEEILHQGLAPFLDTEAKKLLGAGQSASRA